VNQFELEVRLPDKLLFCGPVQGLSAQAIDGRIGIFPGHAPLATELSPGRIVAELAEGGERSWQAGKGFLVVDSGRVSVLTDSISDIAS
jgi:F-type H+-transporting ATPase subunit epsilon